MKSRLLLSTLLGLTALGPGALPRRLAAADSAGPLSDRSVYQIEGAWTDDAGSAFRLADLRGHPVVLAMIFTRCGYACPLTVRQMEDLEKALPEALRADTRFVLVSFDSQGDTPAALRAYRQRFGLDARRWVLLHGNADQVRVLAMVLGVSYAQTGLGSFAHSSLVTVLNSAGEIGYQRPSLEGATAEAVQAVAAARVGCGRPR